MKLVTFSIEDGASHLGALKGDEVLNLGDTGLTLDEVVRSGDLDPLRRAARGASRHPLAAARLHAPIRPGKVLCSGINYRGHATENPRAVMPAEPFFAKLPSSVCGHEDPVARWRATPASPRWPTRWSSRPSSAAPFHQAAKAEVMPAIFGYTLLNDLSARDVQFKDAQITLGRNFAGFAPIGPCIVTADAMPDPTNVRLTTRVDGRSSRTARPPTGCFPCCA